jgi:phospholipid-binding lipoprotein MlaA
MCAGQDPLLMRILLALAAVALATGVSGCASTGDADPRDPLEPVNRAVYRFNDGLDQALVRPLAAGYREHVPGEIRSRVRNLFSNIDDVFVGVNDFLQGNLRHGVEDWARVLFNTTFGLGGLHDVAAEWGLDKRSQDFGRTFARWGVGDGPYLVLPVLGPSNLRDAAGTALELYTDPLFQVRPIALRNSAVGLRFTAERAELLDAADLLEEAALDRYAHHRDAYLQRRRYLIDER